jgi:hypothetical protein
MEAQSTERIRKEVTKQAILVSRVYKSDYQKEGTLTAELKQVVETKSFYPTKSISNSLSDNIFSMAEFGFREQEYDNKETRVAWIDVPMGTTVEQVTQKIASLPNATLYRVLSNRPKIADTEEYAINSVELDVTLDTFADRQVVRYPIGNAEAGKIATDINGKVQYRRIAFSTKGIQDVDTRTEDPADYYASATIQAELQGVSHTIPSQSIGG